MRLSMERPSELTEGITCFQHLNPAVGGLMADVNVKGAKDVRNVKKPNNKRVTR